MRNEKNNNKHLIDVPYTIGIEYRIPDKTGGQKKNRFSFFMWKKTNRYAGQSVKTDCSGNKTECFLFYRKQFTCINGNVVVRSKSNVKFAVQFFYSLWNGKSAEQWHE